MDKKKLIIIIVASIIFFLMVVMSGIAYLVFAPRAEPVAEQVQKKPKSAPADEEVVEGEEGDEEMDAASMAFVPMEPFVVNLKAVPGQSEAVAQVSISLALSDPKAEDAIKKATPLIRDRVLKILSEKTAQELMSKEGKDVLAKDLLKSIKKSLGSESGRKVKEVLFGSLIVQ